MHDTVRPDSGHLLVITGNMMSGKTEELIARLRTLERVETIRRHAAKRDHVNYPPRNIGVYKHSLDKRYSTTEISSHSGQRLKATSVTSAYALLEHVIADNASIVACDEVQFFMEKSGEAFSIVEVLMELLSRNCEIIVSGLDKDFRGMPFGPMGDILALADERVTLKSTCVTCGAPAVLPQRIINGRPAEWSDPVVFPGATEVYEPRCRRCHVTSKFRQHDSHNTYGEIAAAREHP
jgi:thymidine kinase